MPERANRKAARAFWSGTLTFGLVSIPVDLFSAVHGRETSMRMVDAKGKPLGRRYYCPEHDKTLDAGEIVRGYEVEKGKVVVVTDEELDAIAPEMTRDIDLRRFVPREHIASAYYDRPYFLAPSGRSAKAYHLLAEVMQRTGRAGVGTFVMRGHQYLVAILSEGGILRAETLRFAAELRSPEVVGLPKREKPPAGKVRQFSNAIRKLTRNELSLDELSDWYAAEIHKLVERKEKEGKDVIDVSEAESEEAEQGAEVIDLMQLLRERLQAGQKRPPHRASRGHSRGSRGGKRKRKAA